MIFCSFLWRAPYKPSLSTVRGPGIPPTHGFSAKYREWHITFCWRILANIELSRLKIATTKEVDKCHWQTGSVRAPMSLLFFLGAISVCMNFHINGNLGGGNSNMFIFTSIPGKMIQFDEHIFEMGWNHQPGICFRTCSENKKGRLCTNRNKRRAILFKGFMQYVLGVYCNWHSILVLYLFSRNLLSIKMSFNLKCFFDSQPSLHPQPIPIFQSHWISSFNKTTS